MQNSTQNIPENFTIEQEVSDLPIQNELSWGKSYRDWNSTKESPAPVKLKPSPINIPFKICRALNFTAAKKKKPPISHHCQNEIEKVSLLDRSAFTQDQYMDLLAIPHTYGKPQAVSVKKKKKKKKKRDCCLCKIEPCPPRLIQMAVPRKRLVWENWKAYQHVVSTEFLTRYDELLKSGFNNLNLSDARYYFKKLNKQKRKALRKKKKLKNKKKLEKIKGDQEWIKTQINDIATAIIDYYKDAPKFLLNFRQLLVSENILGLLRVHKLAKIKKRNTKHHRNRTIIEMCDKIARAIDDINMFAGLHPGAEYEDAAVVYQPSIEGFEGEEEGEEEEFYESEEGEGEEGEGYLPLGEEDEGYGPGGPEGGAQWAEEEAEGDETRRRGPQYPTSDEDETRATDDTFAEGDDTAGDISYGTDEPTTVTEKPSGGVEGEEEEGEGGTRGEGQKLEEIVDNKKDFVNIDEEDDFAGAGFGRMDRDTLEKLIEILSQSSPDDLAKEIGTVEGVTYGDVLEKLKELRDGRFDSKKPKPFLEDIMIDWVKKNEPEEVDDPLLEKIHETSTVLSEWLSSTFGEKEGEKMLPPRPPGGFDDGGVKKEDVILEETEDLLDEAVEKVMEKEKEKEKELIDQESEDQMPESPSAAEAAEKVEEAAAAGGEQEGDKEVPPLKEEGEEAKLPSKEEEEDKVAAGELEESTAVGEGEEEAAEGEEGAAEGDEAEKGEGEEEGEEGEKAEKGEGEEEGEEGEKAEKGEGEEAALPTEEGEGGGDEQPPAAPPSGAPSAPTAKPPEEGALTEIKPGDQLQIPGAGEVPTVTVGAIIKGHKPSKVMEHSPQTICCLSLKIWAYWLLEITHNAHNWTKWVREIIKQVREFVAIIRGDVLLPNGQKRVLYKEEWRQFVKDTENRMVNWRQYSNHVKELSGEIMGTVRGKAVNCCPKCLQDHMIKNVVTAHETMQALSEAINCAEYWQRCLDRILEQTTKITQIDKDGEGGLSEESLLPASSSDDFDMFDIVEVDGDEQAEGSSDSSYEIEEVEN